MERDIAQIFQFPVIYDTMTVYDNLAFPLKNRSLSETEIDSKVKEIGKMLELTSTLNNKASGLTADGKQKISLGRGLVRSDVNVIMFDEPLTVIDPHLKWVLRSKLKELHQKINRTMIYVTHDQIEALTFADQVVVMHEGQIVQTGTPVELFENHHDDHANWNSNFGKDHDREEHLACPSLPIKVKAKAFQIRLVYTSETYCYQNQMTCVCYNRCSNSYP